MIPFSEDAPIQYRRFFQDRLGVYTRSMVELVNCHRYGDSYSRY